MIAGALLALGGAFAGVPASWDLDEGAHHRWVLETEIIYPNSVWLYADRNKDVRTRNLRLQMVLDCTAGIPARNTGYLDCVIEDVSLAGTSYRSERGMLQVVLDEMDLKLTGATVDLAIRPSGRLRSVKLEPNHATWSDNRRTRYMEELMRLLVVRAVAPFDLILPAEGLGEYSWPQYESLILSLPSQSGTAGSGRIVHLARRYDGDRMLVSSVGKAMLVDGAGLNNNRAVYLATEATGFTVFDITSGRVDEAVWTVFGEPTASAGILARSYTNRTVLRALLPGEEVTLQPTEESTQIQGDWR